MKIAFQKVPQWEGIPHAEAELARRMVVAAREISLEAIATSDMNKISEFVPDVVVPLHFFLPKLFDALTVGCMWNPVSAIERGQGWDNIKTYDGYSVASPGQEQLVRALKFKSPHPYFFTTLFPSTNATDFRNSGQVTNAVYVGSNWDKNRHRDFFLLAKSLAVYGPKEKWEFLAGKDCSYHGEIPFDGKSILKIYRESGIGLALHHPGHVKDGLPSMRPFEIAASGAVMIADKHPFVWDVFGENVLYLDMDLETEELVEQLQDHVGWIQSHPDRAIEMAHTCHTVFNEKYSLEVLLENLVNDISAFQQSKKREGKPDLPKVEIIVRTDGSQRVTFHRALHSIERQLYSNVTGLVVYRGAAEKLDSLKKEVHERFPELNIRFICANKDCDRSTQFFTGIRESRAPFIGFLDHDDVLFSDHVEVLIRQLQQNPDSALVHSGSVRVWEGGEVSTGEQTRTLAYYKELNKLDPFVQCLTSNSYLIRRSKIPWCILHQPIPHMQSREDYIFLVLLYNSCLQFLFSEKVTCAFYWRVSMLDNSAFQDEGMKTINRETFDLMRLPVATRMDYGKKITYDDSGLTVLVLFRRILSVIKGDVLKIVQWIKRLS